MDIKHQIEISSNLDKVYEAITSAHGIHGWWSHNSAVSLNVGAFHIMYFVKEGQSIIMKFRVDELVPGRKVSWTCTENGNPAWVNTTISFELAGGQSNTSVSFKHTGWDQKFEGTPLYISVAPTWEAFLKSLKSYCETGVGQPW